MMGGLLALVLAVSPPAFVPPAPVPIAFHGFVFDPIREMRRMGLRELVVKYTDDNGHEAVAFHVYEHHIDVYGNEYWTERTSICSPPVNLPAQPYDPPRSPSPPILFDRFHPPDNDGQEQQ